MEKYRDKIVDIVVIPFILLLAFIFMFESPLNMFESSGTCSTDSSVFKTVGFYMQNGYMPYRDIFDHKGPLIYIYNYLGNMISYWRGIWLIELISLSVTFYFMFQIAHIFCGRILSFFIVLGGASSLFPYFRYGNYTEEYALPFIAIALYIFIDYFAIGKTNKIRLIFCGLSFGAVCMLRINMISTWIIFCIAILLECIKEKKYKQLLYFIEYFMAGVLLIVIPIFLWLMGNHAFGDFINDYIVFNLKYTSVDWYEKFFSFMNFFNNKWVLSTMAITILLLYKKRNILFTTYLFYYLLTLIMISISGREYSHYGMILVPMFIFPIASLVSLFWKQGSDKAIIAIGLYILSVNIMPVWLEKTENVVNLYKNRTEEQSDVTQETCIICCCQYIKRGFDYGMGKLGYYLC